MRNWTGTIACIFLTAIVFGARAHAQQARFQRLFSPASTLTVILEMPEQVWDALAAEQPVGGTCNFSQSPSIDRYHWHSTNATLIIESSTINQRFYSQIGIKKKSFCGSFDTIKPSLSLNLSKYNNQNEAKALSQIGTTRLSLENSKQDGDLFRQCAGYYVFRSMNVPAPMCSFASLYRRDGTADPVFLGVYVLTEPVKEDFFLRRPGLHNVPAGSLYEFEYPDDFTSATLSQLLVEWSATSAQDFSFSVNAVQTQPANALKKILDLPAFINFWATEIFLKSGDGFTFNTNNAFLFDGPVTSQPQITRTRFRFVPHGLDTILSPALKPSVSRTSVVADLAYKDDGLRYQLIKTLGVMSDRMENANIPGQVESYVSTVLRSWRGTDTFFGNDRNHTIQMAENVRLASAQAIVDLRTVFGHAVDAPNTQRAFHLFGSYHAECLAAPPLNVSTEARHISCAAGENSWWRFDAAPISMASEGFTQPLLLYRVRARRTNHCLEAGAPFPEATSLTFKLEVATCSGSSFPQRFYLVRREGRTFELRSFTQDACAHFSDGVTTSDNHLAVYLAPCNGSSKNLIERK
jgi:CotH kinase protein